METYDTLPLTCPLEGSSVPQTAFTVSGFTLPTKRCNGCQLEKPISEFPKNSTGSSKHGIKTRCKICNRADDRNRYRQLSLSIKLKKQERNKIRRRGPHAKLLNAIYSRNRRKNLNTRLSINLRGRLYQAIKKQSKTGSAVRDLGCSIPELKTHLENQFSSGMSWENYGQWHIDHVKPLSSFDLAIREDFLKACHFTNLQPLWAHDNLSKNNKLN